MADSTGSQSTRDIALSGKRRRLGEVVVLSRILPRQLALANSIRCIPQSPPDPEAEWLKKTLAQKTEPVRQEIHAALQVQGFAKNNFERIGL
jgi:hypothetical protein